MSTKEVIKSQYHASLEMLKQTIAKCPDSLWNHPDHSGKFWHIAYHVIFYTHLYLSPKEEVLAYFEFCQERVDPMVDALDLEAESGFYWLPFGKLELQFYNIRHVQHHAGELADRLGTSENIEIDWVGMRKGKDN